MDSTLQSPKQTAVVDTPAAIKQLVACFLLLFLALFMQFMRYKVTNPQQEWLLTLLPFIVAALGLLKFYQFRLSSRGFVVDRERGTLSYPGSAVEEPGWAARLCPAYWLMCLRRYELPLNAISKVSSFEIARHQKHNGRRQRVTSYMVGVSGHFGTDFGGNVGGKANEINLALLLPLRRDELYKALHAVLDENKK